ncbi:MAG: substrate-binding domain-containing protein [Halanaerobiales bacterium]
MSGKRSSLAYIIFILLLLMLFFPGTRVNAKTLRLATTTSTEDSGLLEELLPEFQKESGHEVDVIAVGTGQALEIGRSGDADILLVHAPDLEKEFVNNDYGTERYSVMYNDFVLAGPQDDPADIKEREDIEGVINTLYDSGEKGNIKFTSRGDESGTHVKEKGLWEFADFDPENIEDKGWYQSLGQGMGDTLVAANEMQAYVLTDRGTFLSMKGELKNLEIMFEGSEKLHNPYGLVPVNPDEFSNVDYEGAMELVEFFRSQETQEKIGDYGTEEFGQPLFFPEAE